MILNRYHFLFFGFLISLILPYSINIFFSLKSISVGFLTGQIFLFFSIWMYSSKHLKLFFSIRLMLIALLLLFFSFISELSSQESIFNTVVVIGIVIIVYINTSSLLALPSEIFYRLIAHSFIFLSILGFISFSLLIFSSFFSGIEQQFILFIGEPSYFALMIGPLGMVYAFKFNHFKLVIAIFFIYGILFPSLIMSIFGILLFFVYMYMYTGFIKAILILVLTLFTMYIILLSLGEGVNYFISRVSVDSEQMNLSSLAFITQWLNVYEGVVNLSYFGSGLGVSTGVIESDASVYSEAIISRYGEGIANNIGASYLTKMFISIGFGSIIFLFYFVYMVIKVINSFGIYNDISLILLISTVPSLFLRTSGIVSFDLFWIILVMIFIHKICNKPINS